MQFLTRNYDGLFLDRVQTTEKIYSIILVGDCQNASSFQPNSSQIYYIEQQNNDTIVITPNQTLSSSSSRVTHLCNHEILLVASILCQECVKVCFTYCRTIFSF